MIGPVIYAGPFFCADGVTYWQSYSDCVSGSLHFFAFRAGRIMRRNFVPGDKIRGRNVLGDQFRIPYDSSSCLAL